MFARKGEGSVSENTASQFFYSKKGIFCLIFYTSDCSFAIKFIGSFQ